MDDIRPTYAFDVSCQRTVPEALIAFLDADSFEDAVRNAVSLGGDSDTLACIAGAIADAFYGSVPMSIRSRASAYLPPPTSSPSRKPSARNTDRRIPWHVIVHGCHQLTAGERGDRLSLI